MYVGQVRKQSSRLICFCEQLAVSFCCVAALPPRVVISIGISVRPRPAHAKVGARVVFIWARCLKRVGSAGSWRKTLDALTQFAPTRFSVLRRVSWLWVRPGPHAVSTCDLCYHAALPGGAAGPIVSGRICTVFDQERRLVQCSSRITIDHVP